MYDLMRVCDYIDDCLSIPDCIQAILDSEGGSTKYLSLAGLVGFRCWWDFCVASIARYPLLSLHLQVPSLIVVLCTY